MINMNKSISSLYLLLSLLFILNSCKKESEVEEPPKKKETNTSLVSFQSDILPIFNSHCNGSYCHGGGADGKSFTTHAAAVLVPSSVLLGAINHNSGYSPMPKSQAKLMQNEIDTITIWINEGKLNN